MIKTIMAKTIDYKEESIRINPVTNMIDFSENNGEHWQERYTRAVYTGCFVDLIIHKEELLACTAKGIYYSHNQGHSWVPRYTEPLCGVFLNLDTNGPLLTALTTKGSYVSEDSGRTWLPESAAVAETPANG